MNPPVIGFASKAIVPIALGTVKQETRAQAAISRRADFLERRQVDEVALRFGCAREREKHAEKR
jgi:hypothetical protein